MLATLEKCLLNHLTLFMARKRWIGCRYETVPCELWHDHLYHRWMDTLEQKQTATPDALTPDSPFTNAIRVATCRATSADASVVRDLVRAAYAKWVPLLGREPKPITADYDAAVRDHVVDMVRLGETAVALIEMEPEDDHLLVVNVAVSPDHQGRGYGRALLAHAEEFALSLGLRELRLYTSVLLTENVKLYERVGYKVDREEEASPHLGVFVYMSKRL